MNWISEAANKLYYIGNCVSGELDDSFVDVISDATDMAQVVDVEGDSAKVISPEEFNTLAHTDEGFFDEVNAFNLEFGYNPDRNIAWAYDIDNDVHYFFA